MPQMARIIALVAALICGAALARAQGETEVAAFRAAVDLSQSADWAGAEAALTGAAPVTRAVMTWLRLREGAEGGASFAAYDAFVAAHPNWPGLDRLRARGEEAMPEGLPADQVLAYFVGVKPQTGQGAVHLAHALFAVNRPEEADAVLAEAWLTLGLTDAGHAAMVGVYPDILAPLHWDRAQAMLWRWRSGDAARMLSLLTPDQRLLAEARIALIRGDGDRAARVAAVPAALAADAGLAYDRFNRLADAGDFTDAAVIIVARSGNAADLGDPFRWASWRATIARWAMREGRPRDAYLLAANHHLTTGDFYADLEWIAGYVALRYLNDPVTALTHFTAMEGAVSGPISVSRAAYWRGRAEEALGTPDAAAESYARAARFQTAFYGLLAAERLGLPLDPALTGTEAFPDWRQGGPIASDLTAAMLLLIAADLRTDAILFAMKQAQTLDRTGVGQLGEMLLDMDEPFFALTVAKAAVERDIVIPAIYFPLHGVATMDLPVAPELALSIARRESEFNIAAGSPVGALGLMQLMPGTAEEVAGELGIPYSRAQLTTDWQYNATLGSRYLVNLEGMFGLTPVLVAAGYNAGPSRPRQWMSERGDPRLPAVNVIDWIEHIPFSETRTYVMRVTESIPVYRARLTGQTGQVDFMSVLRGSPSVPRPPARPDRTVVARVEATGVAPVAVGAATADPVAAVVAEAIATPAAPASPHAPQSVARPQPRPRD